MIDIIQERRVKLDDKYKLYVEIPEKEYLTIYNRDISVGHAEDILMQYLNYYKDDARIKNVEIKHDKNNHSINIQADLIYEGNDHTTSRYTPNYLRTKDELRH